MVNFRSYAAVLALLCALALACGARCSVAQSNGPSDSGERPPADAEGPAGGVRESKPELYHLPDKNGKFIKVPNFSWEEWRRLWELDRKLRSEPPPYEIEGLKIEGQVEDRHAVLDVEARIKLRKLENNNGPSWLRIPLRFGNAVIRGRPKHEGPGDQFTDFEPAVSGFVFWIRAEEDTQHSVTMKLVVPLDAVGGETSLDFSTPAHVPLDMKLNVPMADAVATSANATDTLTSEPLHGGGSQLTIKGAGGDKRISWREAREVPATVPERLDVTGTIRVTVHSPQYVTSDANLNVRSSAGPIDSFVIRLPPAMRLHSWYSPGNRLEVLGAGASADETPQSAAESQMVLVSVLRKDIMEVNLRLQTELMALPATLEAAAPGAVGSSDAVGSSEFLQTGGFEVLGAAEQQGQIEYTVQGDWSLRWLEGPEVTRLDEPADMPGSARVAARFKYFRQPFSLQLAIERKKRRMSVEPTYHLVFSPGEVHLFGSLTYHLFGGSVGQLEVNLEGWTVDELVPDKVVETAPVDLDQVTPLTLRPVGDLPVAVEKISLNFTAHRKLPAEPGPIFVSLPVPLDCTVRPASVSVRSADNVELTPRPDELRGLIPESLAPPAAPADLAEAEYRYRDRGTGEPAVFVCDLQVHAQAITAAVDGSITLNEDHADVTQVLKYNIDYEKSRYLTLEIPAALLPLHRSNLQIRLAATAAASETRTAAEDRSLPLHLIDEEPGDSPMSGSRLAQVDLLSSRKDSVDLVAHYVMPLMSPGAADQNVPVPISAILPAVEPATRFLGSTFRVSFPQGMEVSADAAGWQSEPGRAISGLPHGELQFTSSARQSELPLQVKYLDRRAGQSTVVRQAWLQTWLTSDDCQDRAVFRLQTGERRLRIQLPDDTFVETLADVQVAVDRRRIASNSLTLNREQSKVIEVTLPDEAVFGEHVVELWYRREQGRPAQGRFSIDAPTVLGASRADRSFWQLITPADEHLIWGPPGLTPLLSWKWRGLYWGCQASLGQEYLEHWIGSSTSDPVPPSANQYLFTTFSSLKSQHVVTLPRHTIMLAVSGVTLAAGVLLIYFPLLRHPVLLLCAGVGLLAAAMLYPEPALLAGQAGALGLAMMLVSQFLHWALARRHRTEQVVRGRTLTGTDSKTAEVQFLRSEADSQVTTAAAPVSFRLRATEVKS